MKKTLLTAAILAALTVCTVPAFAAGLVISGDAQTMIQTTKGQDDYSDARLRINFDFDMGDGMYAHARIMGIDQQGYGNNYAEAGTGSKGATMNMEQMYIGGKFIGDLDMKFGRQPVYIGRGMLADINGIVGASVAATTGQFSLFGFGGRASDGQLPVVHNHDVLAGSIGAKLDGANVGVGYLKKDSTTYWSYDADVNIAPNVNLSGVYMKNETAKANGFIVKTTVGQIAKKGDFSYALSYRSIADSAVDGNWVYNGGLANSKGIRLEAKYMANKSTLLWIYQDITKQHSNESIKPNQFRAELDFFF